MWLKLLPLLFTMLEVGPPAAVPPATPPTVPPAVPPATPPVVPPGDPDDDDEELGPGGKAALKAERTRRRQVEADFRTLQASVEEMKTKLQEKEDAEAAQQGQWQELATKRGNELTTLKDDVTAKDATIQTLTEFVTKDLEAALEALPPALLRFDPGEEAPLAERIAWLTTAKEAAADMEPQAPGGHRNPSNPPPGEPKISVEDATKRARAGNRYRV